MVWTSARWLWYATPVMKYDYAARSFLSHFAYPLIASAHYVAERFRPSGQNAEAFSGIE